jgi:hypothetical protein
MTTVISFIVIAVLLCVLCWYLNRGKLPLEKPTFHTDCSMPSCDGEMSVVRKLKSPLGYTYNVTKCKKCGAINGTCFRRSK